MKIKLTLDVSETFTSVAVTTEELGFTDKEWKELTLSEKDFELQKYADEMPNQPYWSLRSYTEKETV